MTETEVQQVLGEGKPIGHGFPQLWNTKYWESPDRRRAISVEFGDDGKLETAKFTVGLEPLGQGPPPVEPEETWVDFLLQLFRR
jgi:hypothetical protein